MGGERMSCQTFQRCSPSVQGRAGRGKGDVLPLPELIITWPGRGAGGGVATKIATGLLSWCL